MFCRHGAAIIIYAKYCMLKDAVSMYHTYLWCKVEIEYFSRCYEVVWRSK